MPGRFIKMYGYPQDSTRLQLQDGDSSQTEPKPSFSACDSTWINEVWWTSDGTFFVEQGYFNIKYLIGHIWEEPLTGNHILVLLSQAQCMSRSKTPYLKE
eukprot:9640752-Ditylum_brightwellii.AAC.1